MNSICRYFVSLIFYLMYSFGLSAHADELGSMKFTDRQSLETPETALAYYGSNISHTAGYGAEVSNEIKSLAFGLDYDADQIYGYVRNHVEFHPTFGLSKGALGAHLDKSGNAFDQTHLLAELFREAARNGASIQNVQYHVGTLSLSGLEAESWLRTQGATRVCRLLANGAVPGRVNGQQDCNTVGQNTGSADILHIWVTASVNGVSRVFDPAYKPSARSEPFRNASNQSWADAFSADCKNGSIIANSAPSPSSATSALGLNNGTISSRLLACGNQLWSWSDLNAATLSIEELVGDYKIVDHRPNVTSLDGSKYLTSRSFSEIPDRYRTVLNLRVGVASIDQPMEYTFFADEVYGKRLALEPNGFDNTQPVARTCDNTDSEPYNYRISVLLEDEPIGQGLASDCQPYRRGGLAELTLNMPYSADNGSYLDEIYSYRLALVTRAVLGLSLGDFSRGHEKHYTRELGLDRATFYVEESNYACPGESCEPPRHVSYGNRLSENVRYRIYANWAKQFSEFRSIVEQTQNTRIIHHYSMGWVSARTFVESTAEPWGPGPVDPAIVDNRFWIGDEGITSSFVSSLSHAHDVQANAPTRRILANGAAMLEASAYDQLMDTAASTGVGHRFRWANLTNRSRPSGIDYSNYTHFGDDVQGAIGFSHFDKASASESIIGNLTSDGEQSCSTALGNVKDCFQYHLNNALLSYHVNDFELTAANDAYLGPGFRCGYTFVAGTTDLSWGGLLRSNMTNANLAGLESSTGDNQDSDNSDSGPSSFARTPIPDSYFSGGQSINILSCEPNLGRAGAFIASKDDFSEIAYIEAYPFQLAKGGGASAASPRELSRLKTPTAASILGASTEFGFVSNVDPKSGNFTYTDRGLLSSGTTGFPHSLSFSRSLRTGSIGYDDPIWSSSWHMPATLSGAGDFRMGTGPALFSAPTLAAIAILEGIYTNNGASQLNQDIVGAILSSYWSEHLTNNVVSVGFGGTTEQFIRKPGTNEFWSTTLTGNRVYQQGSRYRSQPPSRRQGYPTSEAWLYDRLTFTLRTTDNQEITYEYWQSRHPSFGEPAQMLVGHTYYESGMKHGFHATKWSFPTGVEIVLDYEIGRTQCDWPTDGCTKPILRTVSNNLGHRLIFEGLAESPTRVTNDSGQFVQLFDDRVVQGAHSSSETYTTQYNIRFDEECATISTAANHGGCIKNKTRIYLDKLIGPGYSSAQPSMSVAYDEAGKVRTLSNAEGQSWTFHIGGGRMAKTTNPLNISTSVTYDEDGNSVATMTPPLTN